MFPKFFYYTYAMVKYFATYATLVKFSSATKNSRPLKIVVDSVLKLAPTEPETTYT